MISNQVLQTTIDGLKSITRIDICVMDIEGKALATTINNVEEYEEAVMAFVDSPADSQVLQGYQFFKVFDDHQLEYVILAKGDTDDVYMVGKLAAFQIQNLLVAYKERFDKDNFIKNLLLDNLLLVDIYNRAKKLHIETSVKRVVYIIETNIIKELAEKSDCVIVGRCASYILRDMEHMMSAFVYADQESRVNRAVSEYSVDPRRAEATLRKSDRRRETFYSINTGGNWYDKENYTLCLNSGALGIPLCADIIVSAAQKTIFV